MAVDRNEGPDGDGADRGPVGTGAGVIKLVRGKAAEIHVLMYLVTIAFVVFFAREWIRAALPK